MTSFKMLERTESYYLDLSRIYKVIRRKYQALHRHEITYTYAVSLYLNRFFHLTTAKIVTAFENPIPGKTTLQFMEGREW